MNRLASFYRVSQHEMAGQEAPTFSVMPDVGVPRPKQVYGIEPGDKWKQMVPPGAAVGADASSTPQGVADPVSPDPSGSGRTSPSGNDYSRGPIALPDRPAGPGSVGTEIDSVDTLPPQQIISPAPASPPPAPAPTTIDGGPPPLPGGGPVRRPRDGPDPRAPRRGGDGKLALPEQGRTGVGRPKEALGLPGRGPSGPGPAGRTGPVPPARGPNGPTTSVPSPMGRGISGGTPQPRGLPGPRPAVPGITGTPRSDGVLGGRPAPAPAAGGPAGSRMPPGAGHGQRGVVGAAPQVPGGRGQMSRRPVGNPDGVVGTPKGRTPAAGGRGNGFTAGGTGLVRGAATSRRREPGENEAAQRPDYVVEEDETHLPGAGRHVPPVIGQ